MNTKERIFLKRKFMVVTGIIIIFLLLILGTAKVKGNHFTDYLFIFESQEQYNELKPDQIRLEFDEENIVNLESIEKKDGRIIYTLSPVNSGKTDMTIYNADTGEQLYVISYRVLRSGTIVEDSSGNFTNCHTYHTIIMLFCAVLTVVLWISFGYVQKALRYTYQAIFSSGLAIWMTLISIMLIRSWFLKDNMYDMYYVFKTAASTFMILSFPFMLIFCIALSVSNIQLIRKEGFRVSNVLGIGVSVAIIFGVVISTLFANSFYSGSTMQVMVTGTIIEICDSIYVFFECFLLGAMLCGSLAATHEPQYDKDYLIILGCQVRPDGTLYPLIQSRVDRAIQFYQRQLEKTGKKAIFLPSGGKGADEPISEASAIKRYLLEKGIPEEQILVEDQSMNTEQNMCFSKKIIEDMTPDAKVAFSTTNYHVFRSGIISRQNEFEPEGIGSKTKWYFWPNAYIREVIGMMAYKWKSMVIVLIPIVVFLFSIQFVG